jgi:isopenicillin-N N-acyltransferase-like protein
MKQKKVFEVIDCRGTPYEIGRQWGEGCRENMQKALAMIFDGLALMHQAAPENVTANAMKFLPQLQPFDPDLIELIRGQADGAGLKFEEAVALKCGFDLGGYYQQLSGMCTSFAATGSATKSGQTLLGQNLDWVPGTPLDLVRVTRPDGITQLTLVLWGISEYTLNSAGYGICENGTWAAEPYRFPMPIGFYLPKAMRQPSLGQAMEILRENARGLGYYILASADGEIAGIESTQEEYEIMRPERDILVHSNHYLTERFKVVDLVNALVPDSLCRVDRIRWLMEEAHGELTREKMMEILSDHDGDPTAICRHGKPDDPYRSESLASYIMIPEDRAFFIAYGNPCRYEYVEYKL